MFSRPGRTRTLSWPSWPSARPSTAGSAAPGTPRLPAVRALSRLRGDRPAERARRSRRIWPGPPHRRPPRPRPAPPAAAFSSPSPSPGALHRPRRRPDVFRVSCRPAWWSGARPRARTIEKETNCMNNVNKVISALLALVAAAALAACGSSGSEEESEAVSGQFEPFRGARLLTGSPARPPWNVPNGPSSPSGDRPGAEHRVRRPPPRPRQRRSEPGGPHFKFDARAPRSRRTRSTSSSARS